MRRLIYTAASISAITMLTGCAASSGKYPTLEIREAERVSGTFGVPAAIKPAPLPASDARSLPEIEAAARTAHMKFGQSLPAARSTIDAAHGTDPSSNDWAAAQIALADIESLRSDTAIALAELDLLYAQTTLRFEQREAVGRIQQAVERLIAEEDAALTELKTAIAR